MRTDPNIELCVNRLPSAAHGSRSLTTDPVSFLDLPSELFDLIITHIPTSDLINLAQQFNYRLRAESTRAYLIRIGVLQIHNCIYLTQDVPAIAFHLLSAVQLFDEISLVCDLYYFVEYGKELRNLVITTARVRSIRIEFHEEEKSLLHDPRTSASLLAFLAVVKESCHTLRFERHHRDPSYRQLTVAASCPTRRLRPLPARAVLKGLSMLVISANFLRVPGLMAACRGLLQSPHVYNFQLDDCETQLECDGVLAISKFRALESITIRTVCNITIYIKPAFFHRHTKIDAVSLCAYAISRCSPTPPTPPTPSGSLFPLPRLARLSLTTNHHLRGLEGPSHLRRCFLQTPNSYIQPESVEFCFNMNSYFTFVPSLAKHQFKGLELVVRLPNHILEHVAHFQHSGDVCFCKDFMGHRLLGVEKLEVEVDSFNEVVAVSS